MIVTFKNEIIDNIFYLSPMRESLFSNPFRLYTAKARMCLLWSSIQSVSNHQAAMENRGLSCVVDSRLPFEVNRTKLVPQSAWNTKRKPAVLIACGSYSPPTIMHTRIFETARDHFDLNSQSKIQIVHDSYGKKDLASADHRVEMVCSFTANISCCRVWSM